MYPLMLLHLRHLHRDNLLQAAACASLSVRRCGYSAPRRGMSYATTHGDEQSSAIVLDVGSNSTKAGFAGEDSPQHVFSSAVGTWTDDGGSGKVYLYYE
jgi:hypothetical protein